MFSPKASRWLLILPAALTFACGSSKSSSTSAALDKMQITGVVSSEAGAPIANVLVALAGSGNNVTDANGAFTVAATGAKVGDTQAITLTHPDYSTLNSTVDVVATSTEASFTLRPHGVTQTITLPASATDAPAVIAHAIDDGGTSLVIKAGDLTTASGAAATGQANVRLTYWHPQQSLISAPAPLKGASGTTGVFDELTTWGMTNLEVEQEGELLQVAAGHNLTLNFNVPAAMADGLATIDPNTADAIHLWYADDATGIWQMAGTMASGAVSIDANARTVTAQLPHLSAWNIDGVNATNMCVTGTIIDNCGKPEGNQKLTLWQMAGGQLAQYTITTAADGTFCANLNGSSNASSGGGTANFYMWVSDYQNPNSAACNPTKQTSFTSLCTNGSSFNCAGVDIYANTTSASAIKKNPVATYKTNAAACGMSEVAVPLCGYCAGTGSSTNNNNCYNSNGKRIAAMKSGGCGTLPTMTVPWCGAPPSNVDVCSTANAKHQGDPCNKPIDCCPNATLTCSDGLCVPLTDAG